MNKFDRGLPKVSDLQALLALHEDGTVSKAAQRLGLSQPALSYALDKMRKRFNDALFVRAGNRMMATPLARQLIEPADRVIRTLQTEIVEAGRFDPAISSREFRLAVNEIGAVTMVPRLLQRFKELASQARLVPVSVSRDALASKLESGAIDMAAGHFPHLAERVHQQLLFERSYICIARTDHPSIGTSVTLEMLATHPRVQTDTNHLITKWLHKSLREVGGDRAEHMSTHHHIVAVPFIVEASDYIAIVPEELFEKFRPIARIKGVKIPIPIPRVEIHQYWHPGASADPSLQFLRQFIFETVGEVLAG